MSLQNHLTPTCHIKYLLLSSLCMLFKPDTIKLTLTSLCYQQISTVHFPQPTNPHRCLLTINPNPPSPHTHTLSLSTLFPASSLYLNFDPFPSLYFLDLSLFNSVESEIMINFTFRFFSLFDFHFLNNYVIISLIWLCFWSIERSRGFSGGADCCCINIF
jgi:hypothetical protein